MLRRPIETTALIRHYKARRTEFRTCAIESRREMSHRGWTAFAIVQLTGEVCAWAAPHFLSWSGPALWASGFILLLPGDVLSTLLVERLLWQGSLTLFQLSLLEIPAAVAINAAVWWACWQLAARGIRLFLSER